MRLLQKFRVLTIDLRGHGDSDWDPERRYGTEVFAEDLSRAIAYLRLEPVVLIGHSLGADIAIRYATANAARIAALVIVDFGPELSKVGVDEVMRGFAETPRIFESVDRYAQWLIEHRPLADRAMLRHFARCSLRQRERHWELKTDPALTAATLLDRFEANDGRYCDLQMWLELERIKCPSLIVRGMGSGVFPYDVASRMAEQSLSAGRLVTIAAAGHSVMLDNPAELSARVVGFLAELRV